ncbi:MAG TPA: hypothetical protein PK395_18580 [bacterium]|nr:hypothetical protein [bacterium]
MRKKPTLLSVLILSLFPSVFQFVSADPDSEPPGHDPDKGKPVPEFYAFLVPGDYPIPGIGQPFIYQPLILSAVAAAPFSVAVIITDEEGRRADVGGHFAFTWSKKNHLDPENPPVELDLPKGKGAHYKFQHGLLIFDDLHYDECGLIQLTGEAHLQIPAVQGTKKVETTPLSVLLHPWKFLLNATCPIVPVQQAIEAQPTYSAGAPFDLTIYAVNARSEVTRNYPYDDEGSFVGKEIQVQTQIVVPQGSPYGRLCFLDGTAVAKISADRFTNGICTLNGIAFSDAGIFNVTVMDSNYFGVPIAGSLEWLGRFVPHHFEMGVDLPPMNRSPGNGYTYSGEPFSATVTVRAMNALPVPAVTCNYHGELARVGGQTLRIEAAEVSKAIGTVSAPTVQPRFSNGVTVEVLSGIQFAFRAIREPKDILFVSSFEDLDHVAGSVATNAVSFRCGKIRFRDRYGVEGDYLRIASDIDWYSSDGWRLNEDENHLVLAPGDLRIQVQSGSGTVQAAGEQQFFFGGRVRGGQDPLRVLSESVTETLSVEVDLAPSSRLKFLESVPARWTIDSPRSIEPSGRVRKKVLYEREG